MYFREFIGRDAKKSFSNLTHLKISWEYDLKKNKNLAEALKKHPPFDGLRFYPVVINEDMNLQLTALEN